MVFLSTLLISMFVTMALIPILRAAALRLHAAVDIPDARKVHDHPVPKVGGLAMAVAALVPIALLADGDRFVKKTVRVRSSLFTKRCFKETSRVRSSLLTCYNYSGSRFAERSFVWVGMQVVYPRRCEIIETGNDSWRMKHRSA